MRLEKIILDGFKSFADKTEFSFDAAITGIVGPNGCGKSNVVDAVKWVLGEQKLKSLRSDQMADVIFGGSGSRKPLGTAEVTLVLSNPQAADPQGVASGRLPIDTEQVSVSRRIYRSGDCEYRINGKLCRLKDIRELFMDTGVATRAYSIIEQGQVDQLVSASKQDRRLVFEEAAGVSKYKAHKKEALRKLERTEQNLLRLADILAEVGKRLRSVKLQAGKARNYLEYSQRLKELQVNFSLVEYGKNKEQLDEKSADSASVRGAVLRRGGRGGGRRGGSQPAGERDHRQGAPPQRNGQLARGRPEQDRSETPADRVPAVADRGAGAAQEHRVAGDRAAAGPGRGPEARSGEPLQRIWPAAIGSSRRRTRRSSGSRRSFGRWRSSCGRSRRSWRTRSRASSTSCVGRPSFTTRSRASRITASNLSNQRERLAGRAQTAKAELERLLTEKAQHNARLGDIAKVLEELEKNLESKRQSIEETEKQIAEDSRRLAASKEARSALSSELAVLTDMERRYEGLGNAVKNIVKSQKDESQQARLHRRHSGREDRHRGPVRRGGGGRAGGTHRRAADQGHGPSCCRIRECCRAWKAASISAVWTGSSRSWTMRISRGIPS